MKKIIFLLAVTLICTQVQAKKVKFAVDMSGQTISANGIHVAGDFQVAAGFAANWDPAITPLTNETGTQVYSIVVDIPAFQKYEYRFVNGDQLYESEFIPDASRVSSSNDNRWLYVDSLANDTTFVGAILFGDQNTGLGNAPVGKKLIRFKVNMMNQGSVSGSGVHVAGNFQSWDPATTRMYSFGGGVFEYIAYVTAGTYEFKYYNGNASGTTESVPSGCATNSNRAVTASNDIVLDPICFGSCSVCFATGVNEIAVKENTIVAPNPALNYTVLTFADNASRKVLLTDISGKVVMSQTGNAKTMRIETGSLARGLYFLVIAENNKTNTVKLQLQ